MVSPAFLLSWIFTLSFLLSFLLAEYMKRASATKHHPIYSLLPLRHNLRETRLISLKPGKWDDPICCHLDVVSLGEKPEFEALSYTWGEKQATNVRSRMRLNGQDFAIALNLETALRHLRSEANARVLWVDAICINQGDIEERNEQVSMMRDIYSSSQRVLIWLGTVDEPRRPKQDAKVKQKQICQWRTDFTTWSESCRPSRGQGDDRRLSRQDRSILWAPTFVEAQPEH